MTNIVIKDVPDEVIAAIDRAAHRLGLSRDQYIRRGLARERHMRSGAVSADDLVRFTSTFADLADDGVMTRAWE